MTGCEPNVPGLRFKGKPSGLRSSGVVKLPFDNHQISGDIGVVYPVAIATQSFVVFMADV